MGTVSLLVVASRTVKVDHSWRQQRHLWWLIDSSLANGRWRWENGVCRLCVMLLNNTRTLSGGACTLAWNFFIIKIKWTFSQVMKTARGSARTGYKPPGPLNKMETVLTALQNMATPLLAATGEFYLLAALHMCHGYKLQLQLGTCVWHFTACWYSKMKAWINEVVFQTFNTRCFSGVFIHHQLLGKTSHVLYCVVDEQCDAALWCFLGHVV